MKSNSAVFVKLNYKTIGEFKSLIVDREGNFNSSDKYLMCAGKYDKNGWTIVFKAKDYKEAEEIVNRESRKQSKPYSATVYNSNRQIFA